MTESSTLAPHCICKTVAEQERCQWYCLYMETEMDEPEHPVESSEEAVSLGQRIRQLEIALDMAASWFEEYEKHHLLKDSSDSMEKATRNAERAAFLRQIVGD